MLAWRVIRYGEPAEALELQEVPEPLPGPGQALVEVAATALNFNEIDGCRGTYLTVNPPLPYTLGMEVVGDVVSAGDGATAWVGRRVIATAVGAFGAHAQRALVEADMTFDAPPDLPLTSAAAFFFPFHVAHLALVERGHLQPGQTLLVHSGAGGVGSAAVQLGAALGARVLATAGSDQKLAFCRELGADVAINYRDTDIAQAVLEATGGAGVDVVCDLVGGKTTTNTFPCVKRGGRHVVAGFSGGIEAEDQGIAPRGIVFGNFDLCGVMLSYRSDGRPIAVGINPWPRSTGEAVQRHLVELLQAGAIRPVIGRLASWRDLPSELALLAGRTTTGRTVIDWSSS
jgi:NADPH2:quinone reductase